jgi:cob(I)alamin adenosyltransferase
MILIFTGNGKGKTIAAIGQGIRAVGHGKKVLMIQFIKSKKYPSGEDKILPKIKNFKLIKGGVGFVGILGNKLPFKTHQKAAKETLKRAYKALVSQKYDLIILDEINSAINLKLITKKDVLRLLEKIPEKTDLILTGREAPQEFIKKADLVTEFQEIKHPFQKGKEPKKGIEY